MAALLGWLVASYLVGAIPTSYLVGRAFKGIDLRQHGSKNLGATNVYRVMGWKYAIPVGVFDVLKGAVPVWIFGPHVSGAAHEIASLPAGTDQYLLACGLAAVLGHVFSVFVRFKGGKGVATGAGVVLGVAPYAFLVVLAVWVALVALTGYVSVGSIAAAAVFPLALFLLHPERRPTLWLYVVLAALIVWLHRANIRRLVAGTENRFGRRGRPASAT